LHKTFQPFFLLCILFYIFAFTTANAKDVTVGMGLSIPPYIISENNTGIEYEVIASALQAVGHSLIPDYVPLARVTMMLSEHKVDGATPLLPSPESSLCFSLPHISYQNVAISLREKNYSINEINDLNGMSLLAFQNAPVYLGKTFSDMTAKHHNYREDPNQSKQVHALFGGDTDVIILDINIFYYYYNKSKRKADFKPYTVHKIFMPSVYSVGFTDRQLCQQFNRGLKKIKKNKLYDEIFKRYTEH